MAKQLMLNEKFTDHYGNRLVAVKSTDKCVGCFYAPMSYKEHCLMVNCIKNNVNQHDLIVKEVKDADK